MMFTLVNDSLGSLRFYFKVDRLTYLILAQ